MEVLLQGILYSVPPFFQFPWKPVINHFIGARYDEAYRHFRRDHSNSVNLAAHTGCYVMQLVGNFSLMAAIAEVFPALRVLPTATAVVWGGAMFATNHCPADVKLVALGTLVMGWRWGAFASTHWKAMALWQVGLETVAIANLIGKKRGGGLARLPGVMFLAARLALHTVVFGSGNGILNTPNGILLVHVATAAYLMLTATKKEPIPTAATQNQEKLPIYCFTYGLFGWILAGLADRPILFWIGFGYLANIMQGVSHDLTGEQPTLQALQTKQPGRNKFADEWAHTTYFPLLLFSSIRESMLLRIK